MCSMSLILKCAGTLRFDSQSSRWFIMRVALLLSCTAFEGFFGKVQGQTRESYLQSYRSDWSLYYSKGLMKNGIKPHIYLPSLHKSGLYETDSRIAVRFLSLSSWYKPFEWIWFKRLGRRIRFLGYADERLNTIAFLEPLRAALKDDNIDVLYIQEYWTGRFDHIVERVSVPVTAADHGSVWRNAIRYFKAGAFAKTSFVYCQTAEECETVTRYGGRPILLPNGCDTSLFYPKPDISRSKNILTIGRLTNRHKRTSDLIHALALLPEDWTLDIVGSGPDLGMLTRFAEDKGVAGRVRFHGFVGRSSVVNLLQSCGVYAMPSAHEAVALAALEAMGCSASVVLSRIKAFECLVDDRVNGRLVPVADPMALSEAIQDAWDKRDIFGKAAVETIRQHFDTHVLYRKLADSLRSIQ
jgi:glycosyltransferase involved in cell wall biosynthesis